MLTRYRDVVEILTDQLMLVVVEDSQFGISRLVDSFSRGSREDIDNVVSGIRVASNWFLFPFLRRDPVQHFGLCFFDNADHPVFHARCDAFNRCGTFVNLVNPICPHER